MKERLQRVLLKNRLMRLIVIYLFFGFYTGLYAQSDIINSPILVSSSGATLMQENYILTFSIGELATPTIDPNQTGSSDIILTQGFHQENYQFSYINKEDNSHKINFYPNPTEDIIQVNCNLDKVVDLYIKDPKGSVIFSILEASGKETQSIDLTPFSQGIYFLELRFNSNSKQVYKIQKFN